MHNLSLTLNSLTVYCFPLKNTVKYLKDAANLSLPGTDSSDGPRKSCQLYYSVVFSAMGHVWQQMIPFIIWFKS